MPFMANRQFKSKPRLFASAENMHYTTIEGRKVLDATAGLWCCNAGHGRKKIVDAVSKQIANLDYAPAFQMGHPMAFQLACVTAARRTAALQASRVLVWREKVVETAFFMRGSSLHQQVNE